MSWGAGTRRRCAMCSRTCRSGDDQGPQPRQRCKVIHVCGYEGPEGEWRPPGTVRRAEEDHNWKMVAHMVEGKLGKELRANPRPRVSAPVTSGLFLLCFLPLNLSHLWLWPLFQFRPDLTREIIWISYSCCVQLRTKHTLSDFPNAGICEFKTCLKSCKLRKSKKTCIFSFWSSLPSGPCGYWNLLICQWTLHHSLSPWSLEHII